MNDAFNFTELMVPLWLMYPHISRYSIGWRMGYGESYAMKFYDWFNGLSEKEQQQFQKMFPEPRSWQGWYEDEYSAHEDIYIKSSDDEETKYYLDLCKSYQQGKKIEFLFFWGHQPAKDGRITKACLSQWWESDFVVDIDKYCCMEQYMMAEKARLFQDDAVLADIMASKQPKQIKDLGRKVRNFNAESWNLRRYEIVRAGNYAKFAQNIQLRNFLIETKERVLVEASPYDKIWGIGMSADADNIENPLSWKGLNLLGFALMDVRDELISVYQNYDKVNWNKIRKEFNEI